MMEARDNVGHLDSGVIDVILHFDVGEPLAQHADERVAQDSVAQVADVCRFVGIDVGVFNDDLAICSRLQRGGFVEQGSGIVGAVESNINVAVAGDFKLRDSRNVLDFGSKLFGDLSGCTLQLASKLESDGNSEFTKPGLLGLFQRNLHRKVEFCSKRLLKCSVQVRFYFFEH